MTRFQFCTKLDLIILPGRKARELSAGLREVPPMSVSCHTHRFFQHHHYLCRSPRTISPPGGPTTITRRQVAGVPRTEGSGVLMLSEMAGAEKELGEAVVINPKDSEEIDTALRVALEMPREVQHRRMGIMGDTPAALHRESLGDRFR